MQQVARIRPAGRREDLRAVTLADGRRFLLEAEQVTFLGLSPATAGDEAVERPPPRWRSLPLEVRLRRLAGLLRRCGFSGSVIAPLLRRYIRPGHQADLSGDASEWDEQTHRAPSQ